jgi:alkylhydroperoxidase family enzyme
VKSDYRDAELEPKIRALMAYAVLVTRHQHRVTRDTIEGLRRHGWTDEEILSATQIIGLFNYYTRMVDALGCDLEDFMKGMK